MPSQEEVLKHVRAAFECEPRINLHRDPVHMTFKDGILTLDGEVEHIVAKKLSLELAAAVPGIDVLVDRLRVTPTLPMRDGAIRDSVRDVLLQEPAFVTFAIGKRDKGKVETVRPAAWEPSGVICEAGAATARSSCSLAFYRWNRDCQMIFAQGVA
jgi:hypothetical protein